jgi:hypothetical protein
MTKHLPWIAVLVGAAIVVFIAAYQPWSKRDDTNDKTPALRAAADEAARAAAQNAARDLVNSDAIKAIARDVARQAASQLAATAPAKSKPQPAALVGTWRDAEGDSTYNPDGTFTSNVDFRIPVPLEAFKATMSVRIKAAMTGTWKLDADKLQVTIASADNVDVNDLKLDEAGDLKSATPDAVNHLSRRITDRLKTDLAKEMAGKAQSLTITSLDATTMTYKTADGTVKSARRVTR